jgi:hypothetical protein
MVSVHASCLNAPGGDTLLKIPVAELKQPLSQDGDSMGSESDEDRKVRGQARVLACIVAGMMTIGGSTMLMVYLNQQLLDRAFDAYQTTDGTVLSSEVRTLPSGSVRMVNATRTLLLSYRYAVEGVAHIGHSLSPHQVGMSLDEDLIEPLYRQFPVGTAVRVHFDPRHLDQAYLLRSTGSNLWVLVTGLLLCSAAAVLVVGVGRIMDQVLRSSCQRTHRLPP